jgi:hypothetical protein
MFPPGAGLRRECFFAGLASAKDGSSSPSAIASCDKKSGTPCSISASLGCGDGREATFALVRLMSSSRWSIRNCCSDIESFSLETASAPIWAGKHRRGHPMGSCRCKNRDSCRLAPPRVCKCAPFGAVHGGGCGQLGAMPSARGRMPQAHRRFARRALSWTKRRRTMQARAIDVAPEQA